MKKRTKKVLSFGVAALMAVSALPFSALSVTASVYKDQTANGGTPYDFVLKEQGTGVQEIQVSKDDVDAGNVTKTLDVFIDSDEWADDASNALSRSKRQPFSLSATILRLFEYSAASINFELCGEYWRVPG